jgi:hypothetical protein
MTGLQQRGKCLRTEVLLSTDINIHEILEYLS